LLVSESNMGRSLAGKAAEIQGQPFRPEMGDRCWEMGG